MIYQLPKDTKPEPEGGSGSPRIYSLGNPYRILDRVITECFKGDLQTKRKARRNQTAKAVQ